jgi:glutathione S-transferase
MTTLYQDPRSGNCYKAVLTAAHLGIPLKTVDIDVNEGLTRKSAFLAKNPNGRVPLLELDDGRFLPESNAIIWYLAEGSELIPADKFARAQMLQWMFFEQYSHEPYIAVARFWLTFVSKEALPLTVVTTGTRRLETALEDLLR